MSVALAHQVSPTSRLTMREAGREAAMRGTTLEVVHVVESLDLDLAEAYEGGLSGEVTDVLSEAGLSVEARVHLATGEDDVAQAILTRVADVGAELLVIGARRRSPVGKFLLGSVAQTVILEADVPVLVVKSDA